MVSYLQIEGLTKSYGDRMLFSDVTFGVFQGDKIGLIARNGTGKSTLLRIIAGREECDSGNIVFRNGLKVGFLDQNPAFDMSKGALENLMATLPDADYTLEDRAKRHLGICRIHDLTSPLSTMSGGQLKRIAIARVLLQEPELLILDEPTNHLDIEMIEWLEDQLARMKCTLLMVTHDRYFLDKICNKIIEIDQQQIFTYQGTYDYYLQKRQERIEAQVAELDKVKNLFRTELEWMRRQPQARGSKAKYRIDNFYELQAKTRTDLRERNVSLNVDSTYIGSKIFVAKDISKAFGDKTILKGWNYDFARHDKVGIIGPNGVGKTTLLRLLTGEMAPDSGQFEIGETVRWGIYSQSGIINLDPRKKVIDAVSEIAEEIELKEGVKVSAMQFLNRFLFTPKEQQAYVDKLSGGELKRLQLALVLMRRPNFLILDEPTNDLDIVTLNILEEYIVNFKGCVLIVSHDRHFLDRTVNHLFVLRGDGSVMDFPGDYSTYRHCLKNEQRALSEEQRAKSEPKAKPRRQERPPRLTWKEQREFEELKARIEQYAERRRQLEEMMNAGTADHTELQAHAEEFEQLTQLTDEAELRLLELMEKDPSAQL